jgi:hypothetical protein
VANCSASLNPSAAGHVRPRLSTGFNRSCSAGVDGESRGAGRDPRRPGTGSRRTRARPASRPVKLQHQARTAAPRESVTDRLTPSATAPMKPAARSVALPIVIADFRRR